jgi:hypothetical protein
MTPGTKSREKRISVKSLSAKTIRSPHPSYTTKTPGSTSISKFFVYKTFPLSLFSQLNTAVKMAFTEFVVPTLRTDPETEATFINELAPFLVKILDTHATPPKLKQFGKIILENGKDTSGDFRLVVGLGSSLPLPSPSPSYSLRDHLPLCFTIIPLPPSAVAVIST